MNDMSNDLLLVAYADGRLDASTSSELEARLAADATLRERLDHIRYGGAALAPAFQALLASAPTEAMQASLARLIAAHPIPSTREEAAPKSWRRSRRVAAAAVFIVIGFGLGLLASFWPGSDELFSSDLSEHDDWRKAVAGYAELYTADTFAGPSRDAAGQMAELARIGGKFGLDLSPDRIAVPNLQFRAAQALSYDGAALGQIAYLDPAGQPVLFCIFADSQPDAELKPGSHEGLASTSWRHNGREFMVIGRASPARVAEIADTLKAKF
jgi:anti-sigma factor RsiW